MKFVTLLANKFILTPIEWLSLFGGVIKVQGYCSLARGM